VFEYLTLKMLTILYNPGRKFIEQHKEITALLMNNASWSQRYQGVIKVLDLVKIVLGCGFRDKKYRHFCYYRIQYS